MNDEEIGKKIISLLKKNTRGMTIRKVVDASEMPYDSVRLMLAKLDGAEKICFKKVCNAKVYFLKESRK